MKIRLISSMLAAAVLLAVVLFDQPASGQQKKYEAPKGPAPRLANGHPDFSGVWQTPRMADVTKDMPCCKGAGQLPYTAWGKQQWDAYDAAKGDYAGSCLPFGLFRSVGGPHPAQIIQNDKYIAFMFEQNSWFHVTPTDGRPHKKDAEPSWLGDSVGHWEGDTLVIDTVNFNGKTKLDTDGHPMSDQMHAIERYSRPDLGHINYVLTVDDPKTYTKKWDSVRTWTLRTDWEIMEYSCEENNKDLYEGHVTKGLVPEAK